MRKADVTKYFGSENKTSKFIGLSRQAVNRWPDPIHVKWALRLEKMTHGDLKFEKELYQ